MSVVSDSPPRIEHFSGVVDVVRDGVAYLTLTDDVGHEIEIEWDAADLESKAIEEGHNFHLKTATVDGNTEFGFSPVVPRPLEPDTRSEIEDVLRRYREREFIDDRPTNGPISSGLAFHLAAGRSTPRRFPWRRVLGVLAVAACALLMVALGMGIETWRQAADHSAADYRILYAQHLSAEELKTLAALMRAAKEKRFPGTSETFRQQPLRPFELSFSEAQAELGQDHPITLRLMNDLTELYLSAQQWEMAEQTARECLRRREQKRHKKVTRQVVDASGNTIDVTEMAVVQQPDDWAYYLSMSQLGAALAGQKKFAAAEPLLVDGYKGLKSLEKDIPLLNKPDLDEAAKRTFTLYLAWGKPQKASEWKTQWIWDRTNATHPDMLDF